MAIEQGRVIAHIRIPNPEDRPTISVPEAGRIAFDLGRNASFEAVKRGDLPVIRVGRRLLVPVAELRRRLGLPVAPGGGDGRAHQEAR